MVGTIELLESRVSPRTQWHVVVLTHASGERALGECSDSGDVAALTACLIRAVDVLRGRDLLAERAEVLAILRDDAARHDHASRLVAATALGGVEQALLDLAARDASVPLWKWLDAAAPGPVPVYANINRMPGGRAPADVAAAAAGAVRAGYTAVKLAPFDVAAAGRPLREIGLARVRAVRDAVGDEVAVHVDCHERLPLHDVHDLLPDLADLGIAWLEDAVSIDRVDDLTGLKAASAIPLAGGELIFDAAEAEPAVSAGVVDVLMPDVKHAGGIEAALDVARALPHVAVSPHNPSGPVATAASAHLFAACPGATVLEHAVGEVPWRSDLVRGGERIDDGHLHVDDRPGLGLELDTTHPSLRVLWSASVEES